MQKQECGSKYRSYSELFQRTQRYYH